jgi:hypothetical protein
MKFETAAFDRLIFLLLLGVGGFTSFECMGEAEEATLISWLESVCWIFFLLPLLFPVREELDFDFALLLDARLRPLPRLVMLL